MRTLYAKRIRIMSVVHERLQQLDQQIEELIQLVSDRTQGFIDEESREDLKARYTAFKDYLEGLARELELREQKVALSDDESSILQPAYTEALGELKVRRGSFPSKEMADCLISAQDYIKYYLS